MGLDTTQIAEPAALSIAGLTRRVGRVTVLDNLTLSLSPGDITALLAPGGSGKSTLVRCLAGLEHASGGISLDGRDVSRLSARRRGFGVVQQPDALLPQMSLADNVAVPLRARQVPKTLRARLLGDMLELMQLGDRAAWLPDRVSPAERQRAVLARAAIGAPRLLLLDEPFSDQEPGARAALAATFRQIQALSGTTTLVATRSAADALGVADHIAVLRHGAIVQHGLAEEVFDHPRDAQVACLLGEQNRLPGQVEALEDDIALVRLACGPLVEAAAGPAIQPGDLCQLIVRPDRVAIAAVPAAEMGDGAVDATLIEARFLGPEYRLRLLIGSGTELIVRRPAAAGLRGLSPGRRVAVAWQPHHAVAYTE